MLATYTNWDQAPGAGIEPALTTDSKSALLPPMDNPDQRKEEDLNPSRLRPISLASHATPCAIYFPFAEAGGVEPLPLARPLVFKTSAQPLELQLPEPISVSSKEAYRSSGD